MVRLKPGIINLPLHSDIPAMTSYPGMAIEVFPYQDDTWRDSTSMERSSSQSTNCTVDSSYTDGSFSSGYYSTGYASTGVTLIEDEGSYPEPPAVVVYPYDYSESQAVDHLLSATGSQYQHSEEQLPQALQLPSPLQLFDNRIPSIEEAARQATEHASFLVINQQPLEGGGLSVITSEGVEAALQRIQGNGQEAARAAVQDILYLELYRQLNDMDHFYTDTRRILEGAAYQLQLRLRGPEVFDICYYAIGVTLAKLRADLEANYSGLGSESLAVAPRSANPPPIQPPTPTTPTTEKERYPCLIPGCEQKAFSRSADLDRHYKTKHVDDDQKKHFLCDYPRCPRHTTPFFRQDHFRDHLRVYHQEDLVRRGNSGDPEWWKSRSRHAMRNGWWRCNRCLAVRVDYAKNGFVCPGCGSPCETERQRYRVERGFV